MIRIKYKIVLEMKILFVRTAFIKETVFSKTNMQLHFFTYMWWP